MQSENYFFLGQYYGKTFTKHISYSRKPETLFHWWPFSNVFIQVLSVVCKTVGCKKKKMGLNEELPVFTETNLGTRIALAISPDITAAKFKGQISISHFFFYFFFFWVLRFLDDLKGIFIPAQIVKYRVLLFKLLLFSFLNCVFFHLPERLKFYF